MRRPTERQAWLCTGLLAVLATALVALGTHRGSVPLLAGGAVLGSAVLGGAAGYLAVVDRDESELRADLDWRFAGPMVACFAIAVVATGASVLDLGSGLGIDPVTIGGVAFSGAFVAMALSSWLVEDRPRVAIGEALAALGWLSLFVPLEVPGLGNPFGAGAVLLVAGASLAILFGPVGDAVRERLQRLGRPNGDRR